METLIVVVAILVVLHLSTWFSRFIKISSFTYQLPYVYHIDSSEIPEAHKGFFTKASQPLLISGFEHCGFIQQRAWEKNIGGCVYIAVFAHKQSQTYAWLHQSVINPSVADPLVLYFITPISNDKLVLTDNQHVPCSPFDHSSLIEHSISCENAEELWDAHLSNLEALISSDKSCNTEPVTFTDITERFNTALKSDFEHAREKGTITGELDQYFLSIKNAWILLTQFVSRQKAAAARLAKRNSSPEAGKSDFSRLLTNDELLAPQVNMASMLLSEKNLPNRPIFAWITFGISLVLFSIFFGIWLGWEIVPILIFVLMFHELGHFFAMRLSGYSQTSIFFIPGLGAAASGKAKNATYWQRVGVFLAGPIPGILLAFALWVLIPDISGWLYGTVFALIVINWINLLPFMPLDGGQIINLSLGETARIIFGWVSAIGLILLAWGLAEPVLWVLGAFGLFTAYARQGQHRLRVELEELAKTNPEPEFVEQALRLMQAPAYNAFDFPSRIQIIREHMEEMHMPRVRPLEKFFGITIYMLSISIPVLLFFVLVFSSDTTNGSNITPHRDWRMELNQSNSEYQSMDVALDAIAYHLEYYDLAEAEYFISEARSFADAGGIPNQQLSELSGAELQLWLQTSLELSPEKVTERVERYLSLSPVIDQRWLEVISASIFYLDPESELMAQIQESTISHLESQSKFSELALFYSQLSYLDYDSSSQSDIREFQERAVDLAPNDEKNIYRSALAVTLLEERNYPEALAIFQQIENSSEADYVLDHNAYGWASFKLGNYEQSIRIYEEGFDANKDVGGIPLLSWLIDRSYLDYAEFELRLNQLVAALAWNNQSEIDRYSGQLEKLANKMEHDMVEELRAVLESQIEYLDGWYADSARERLKVLNRYHPKK